MTEQHHDPTSDSPGASGGAPPPRAPRTTRRAKSSQRGSQRRWAPPRRWLALPEAVQFLGVSAAAQRKWLERAERDEHGRVHMQGGIIAEKRGRLWFIGFPAGD